MSESTFVPSSETLIYRIQEAVSITQYIGQSVELRESKSRPGESSGKCPFHNDSHPSFGVSETKGVFLCRGCGVTGNVVKFRSLVEGRDYDDVKMDMGRELGLIQDQPLSSALKLLDHTSRKYHESLLKRENELQYLAKRGITRSTIEKFKIGYCYGNEFDRASSEKFNDALIAGILTKSKEENGRPYNQMSGRITIPIKNKDGLTIGFGARTLGSSGPKYLNTAETDFFKKSETLFGYFDAKMGISKEKHAIVVEGYMDVITLHQEGINNVVGVMGSSAGSKAFDSLWKSTKRIVFCLDPDQAGKDGTLRSVFQAASNMKDDCVIEIAQLNDQIDPDEYVLKYGADQFKKVIANSTPLSEWLCQFTLEAEEKKNGPVDFDTAENRARFLKIIESVAIKFESAPALQLEIQRQAYAILNSFVIGSALKGQDIQATKEEIDRALEMMQAYQTKNVAENSIVDVTNKPRASISG